MGLELEPGDVLFIVLVLWIAILLLNDGNWGGGRRVRIMA